ncbi:MAG: TIGR03751 family conjugal transfer lipoprotein [Gammaproteobacteria bacterium]|nr:TIGR03751 family conjugal transfer lipoprotein [Gammaproteobacteria bacterium]MYF03292.1 TIGR03751 family conjugal transfer lipoprotein [Gammaproteobacteria bacterium]MYI77404.1 TIGR03751 family conjugal transfer lipoprotein [Gammaproteobacteria bacterium]
MIKSTNFLCCCTLALALLSGCMSSKTIEQSENAATMQEIYDAHFVNLEYDSDEFVFTLSSEETSEYSQTIKNEVEKTFPTLKNPFLVMYVFPRLNTEDGTPIPGYWTTFPLYDKVEFALPGEEVFSGDTD